jgi:hypothetical protein
MLFPIKLKHKTLKGNDILYHPLVLKTKHNTSTGKIHKNEGMNEKNALAK